EVEQPDEALTASELHAQVEHALKDLTPALQQAVRGSLFDGKSPTQLAVDLGLDSGTIRQRLFRGMSQLRLLLKGAVLVLFALFGLRSQGLAGVRKQVLHEAARASAGGATGLAAASWPGRMVMVLVVASLCWVGAKALWPAQDAEMREQGGMELAGISSDHGVDSNPVTELVGMAATEARAVTAKQFVFAAQLVWDTTGEPISGREVSLSLYSGEKASETSGTDGRVSFPFTPSDKPWRLSAISTPQSLGASLFIGRSDPNELLVVRL
ncbi:MAG: sigma-70 family RNA polymerase sigma factor, partial [bacterium]|nr:sigma-70 family RNA polymerase sigma factor [bacterium]